MNTRTGHSILLIVLACAQAAIAQMTVKDGNGNELVKIIDEGVIGSLFLPDTNTALMTQTNRLYNLNGSLIWNGTILGTSGSAGGWTDGGTSVYLTTSTDKVGIGDTSPTNKLDVDGTIGIRDTQILFLPNQSSFNGSLIIGTGGGSLSHTIGQTGQNNTGVGLGVFSVMSTGEGNTAVGYLSMNAMTTGVNNTACGFQALKENTTGGGNTASGVGALQANSDGASNAAGGYNTMGLNTSGDNNAAFGAYALYQNTTGNNNTGIGMFANQYNQEGSNNTIIGYEAGKGASAHNKSGNVFLGYQAGYSETGDNKLYIDNSSSGTPLLWGDFSNDSLVVNDDLTVAGTFALPTGGTDGYVLTSDANGVASWQELNASSDGDWTIQGINLYSAVSGNVGIGTSIPFSPANFTKFLNIEGTNDAALELSASNYPGNEWTLGIVSTGFDIRNNSLAKMRILNNGNLGIGVVSPDSLLHVNGGSLFEGNMRINGSVGLNADPLTGSENTLYLYDDEINSEPRIKISGHNMSRIFLETRRTGTTSGKLWNISSGGGAETYLDRFLISNTDDGDCLVIRDGGNIGIGGIGGSTSPPTSRLMIKGSGNTSGSSSLDVVDSDETSIFFVRDDGNAGLSTTSPTERLDVNGNARIRGIASGAYSAPVNQTSDGTLTTATSDIRMKKDIHTLDGSLDKILQLRGVTFQWKDAPDMGDRIGLIAQEVEEVIPELVFTNPKDGYKGIQYAELTAVLVEAVKAQQDNIQKQQEEIARLRQEIDALKKN